ncbi:RnfABCDGE type electron transport complex subunit D [Desulfobacterales bacterium HSG16]|nr:RnfABCDGE type electron transport complex subunit D [Desulfobacterales bacterium HSG16]
MEKEKKSEPVSKSVLKSAKEEETTRINVGPSPHFGHIHSTTRLMMTDVLIALVPVILVSLYVFQWFAVKQLMICILTCIGTEAACTRMRNRQSTLYDGSAVVTALILGLSLPATAPWYVAMIGSVVAIGIGKMVFGGLGMNLFNPAMVGRAFVMIAFAGVMSASGYELASTGVDALSQATPLNIFKQTGAITPIYDMFWGVTNGSIGETSAFACLLGGFYLVWRGVAAWEIPLGVIIAVIFWGTIGTIINPESQWTVLHHLFSGSLLFGAFFIATDPVTSPLSAKGRFQFGIGVGIILMLLRSFSGYPEGMMFAVLLMNALSPLINRWTIPKPFGVKTSRIL